MQLGWNTTFMAQTSVHHNKHACMGVPVQLNVFIYRYEKYAKLLAIKAHDDSRGHHMKSNIGFHMHCGKSEPFPCITACRVGQSH